MASVTQVKGLPELRAKFAQIGSDVGKGVLRKGAGAGARVVKAAIALLIPTGATGALKRAEIIKFVREASNDTQAEYIVTFRRGKKFQKGAVSKSGRVNRSARDAYYAPFVERGHRTRPAKTGTYRGGKSRPGQPARSAAKSSDVQGVFFMKRGIEASQHNALDAMVSTMKIEIDKVVG